MKISNIANIKYSQIMPDGSTQILNRNTNIVETNILNRPKIKYYAPRNFGNVPNMENQNFNFWQNLLWMYLMLYRLV